MEMVRMQISAERILKRIVLGQKKEYEAVDGLYDYEGNEGARTREDEWNDFLKYGRSSFIAGACFAVMVLHIILMLIWYVLGVMKLSPGYSPANPFYILLWTVGPPAVWIWSTSLKFWQFYARKMAALYVTFAAVMVMVLHQLLRLVIKAVLSVIFLIPITKEVTVGMVVGLGRGCLFGVTFVPTVFISVMVGKHFFDKYTREEIEHFVVTRDMDLRDNKEFKYDLKVIKKMETGEVFDIPEDSRRLHTLANGTTGTGKTSSVLTPAVADDLDQKAHNTDYQKKETAKRLKSGAFEVVEPFTDKTFSISKVRPVYTDDPEEWSKRQEDYKFLRYQAPSAGITVVAPNAAWADEVYELATARGFEVNRIDPFPDDDDNPKRGFKGFNPLFVSPTLRGVKREVDITNKANIFADVLTGIFERGGGGDVYFKNLNSTWTTATCMLVMLAYDPDEDPKRNINQPSPADIQKILNNPDNARAYLSRFAYRFGRKETIYNEKGEKLVETGGHSFAGHDEEFGRYKDLIETNGGAQALEGIDCGIYQYVWHTFFRDILGARREELYDQANGLRMQVNKLLGHRYIRAALCVPDSLAVDLDEMLAEGQVTVVNFALELGKSVSIAFGQFWALCYGKAVTRRPKPENTRIPHFNYIDEFSSIVHPEMDEYFTLHRQYCCANFVALQTLDQMSKSRDTEYMRGILLGNCGTQIVYGRLSTSEMEIYEKMAGKAPGSLDQDTVSQTSITTENPSYSWSRRTTMQKENRMEGSEMRYRDFQTVTVFSVMKNSPHPPFVGKVDFLPPARRKGMPRVRVYWGSFMPEKDRMRADLLEIRKRGIGGFDPGDSISVRMADIGARHDKGKVRHRRLSAGRPRSARGGQAAAALSAEKRWDEQIYVSNSCDDDEDCAAGESFWEQPGIRGHAPQDAQDAPVAAIGEGCGEDAGNSFGAPGGAQRGPESDAPDGTGGNSPEERPALFDAEYSSPRERTARAEPEKRQKEVPAPEPAETGRREEQGEVQKEQKPEMGTEGGKTPPAGGETRYVQMPLNGFLGGRRM